MTFFSHFLSASSKSLTAEDLTAEDASAQLEIDSHPEPPFESPATYISRLNYENRIMLYTHKAMRRENNQIEGYLNKRDLKFAVLYLDSIGDEGRVLEMELQRMTRLMKPPWLFILGKQRTSKQFFASFYDGLIETWLNDPETTYDYDLIIIGDGPGSLSAAKAAISYGRRVLLCSISNPRRPAFPDNVFSLVKTNLDPNADLEKMWKNAAKACKKVSARAKSDAIRALRALGVQVTISPVAFTNKHTIQVSARNSSVTGLNFLLACDRQTMPNKHLTSVDKLLISRARPENALVLGNSVLAIEVATLLHFLRVPVTLMYPGRFLKHFDQDCVQRCLTSLVKAGVRVESCLVTDISSAPKGKLVTAVRTDAEVTISETFDKVVDASERKFNHHALNLVHTGVEMDKKGVNVVCNERDQTSVSNIYAVGGIVHGRPHLSSMAETAARLLSERLFGMQDKLMDYSYLPRIVSGTIEYGSVGLSEEAAVESLGRHNVSVYKASYKGFDHMLDDELEENFVKLVCRKPADRIVGVHVVGQNVEAMLMGYTLAVRKWLTKPELDECLSVDLSNIHMITQM